MEALEAVCLNKHDLLVWVPTGNRKSACFKGICTMIDHVTDRQQAAQSGICDWPDLYWFEKCSPATSQHDEISSHAVAVWQQFDHGVRSVGFRLKCRPNILVYCSHPVRTVVYHWPGTHFPLAIEIVPSRNEDYNHYFPWILVLYVYGIYEIYTAVDWVLFAHI